MKRLLFISIILLIGCTKQEEWTAFVYPDRENIPGPVESENYVIGKFETLDACQASATDQLRTYQSQNGTLGDYICGLNCTHNKDFGNFLVCKEKHK